MLTLKHFVLDLYYSCVCRQWVTASRRWSSTTWRHIVLDSDSRNHSRLAPEHPRHYWSSWCSCQKSRTASHCWYLTVSVISSLHFHSLTIPRSCCFTMRICFAYVFFCIFLFFVFVFFRPSKIWDNRSRERLNEFSWNFYQTIVGKCSFKRRAAAWRKSCRRLANGECWWVRNLQYDFRNHQRAPHNLRYDSCGITRGRHRQLHYTTMSGRIDVI